MHKFKLKKDGKVVGYCKWTEDWGWKYDLVGDFKNPFTHFAVAQSPKGITAHPFVCLDKHGKEVYAGDKVVSYKGQRIFEHEGIVTYRPSFADYVIAKKDVANWGIKSEDIELIKD